ncbi:MAG: ABC transporter permease [Actinomycetaceae bacterium]|nr:ABC transporter permease [Actinomycetaceae bacterium]
MTSLEIAPKTNMAKVLFQRFVQSPVGGSAAALLLLIVAFALASDRFLVPYNLSLILQQSMVVGVLAIAQTIIILTAGIDLSIGATCVLGTIVIAQLVPDAGPYLALLGALAVCMMVGAANGFLVANIDLPPFIVTLGMFTIVSASTQLLAGSSTYPVSDPVLRILGQKVGLGQVKTTIGVFVLLALYLLAWYILGKTAGGKHLYAVGGSPVAASLSGIKTKRVLFLTYLISGVIAAIAAWVAVGRIPNADPNALQTANLDTITAVVIGGTSLFGGRGSVLGTLIGVLIVGVLRNGLTLIGVDNLYQNIATGCLVILAVAFDQFTRRRSR